MSGETRLRHPNIRPDGLQLDEARERQRRFWRIQRIAWWCFGAIMLTAVLGMTGSGGYFQKQTVRFENARVEVPLVSRWEGSDDLTIIFASQAKSHTVSISQPFFDRFQIERIQPEPHLNVLAEDAQLMTFPTTGHAPYQVKFDLRAMHFGWTGFDMTIASESHRINLIVLP